MLDPLRAQLSRRESQIMDIIFQKGEATAVEIMARLPDSPSNSSVRTLLAILEDKGHLTHRRDGSRFIYKPTLAPDKAKQSALSHLIKTFFGGSVPQVMAALLSTHDLSETELDELTDLIAHAKQEDLPDVSSDHE